jgi:hypothetical protein
MARALDEGGMVWEGKACYTDLEELLRDLDEGIARWTEKSILVVEEHGKRGTD